MDSERSWGMYAVGGTWTLTGRSASRNASGEGNHQGRRNRGPSLVSFPVVSDYSGTQRVSAYKKCLSKQVHRKEMAMSQRVLLLKGSPVWATGIFFVTFDACNYETHNAEQNPHLKSYDLFKMVSERFEIQQQILLGFLGGASGKEPACQCRRHKRHGTELQRAGHD